MTQAAASADTGAIDAPRFLCKQEVVQRVGIPASSIYELMSRGVFPRPVRISPRLVAWIESEIIEWQRARIEERNAAASKARA